LIHFSCHGYFDFDNPLKSCLKLADADVYSISENSQYLQIDKNHAIDLNKCLTLSDIFRLNFSQCRLVTLWACETGLVDFRDITDEYIGLSSGFILAGAACVVNTRWVIDDFSRIFT
jgi:CHAT domain-containing protein